jgi:hypothetical protein
VCQVPLRDGAGAGQVNPHGTTNHTNHRNGH